MMNLPRMPALLQALLLPLLLLLSLLPYAHAAQLAEAWLPLAHEPQWFWPSLFLQHFAAASAAGLVLGALAAPIYRQRAALAALALTLPVVYITLRGLDLSTSKWVFHLASQAYAMGAYVAITVSSAHGVSRKLDAVVGGRRP
jgi:hypothetical protein